jgi:hypothetical protein
MASDMPAPSSLYLGHVGLGRGRWGAVSEGSASAGGAGEKCPKAANFAEVADVSEEI